jgi:hypothetical protein
MTDFYRQRLLSRVESEADLSDKLVAIKALSEPASREWLTGRVTALLTAYFGASLPAGVLAVELADWLAELECFPEWAVRDAIRWWRGAENEHRSRKPHPGDIAARCRREMELIDLARKGIDTYRNGPVLPPSRPADPPEERTPESQARMMDFIRERFPQIVRKVEP